MYLEDKNKNTKWHIKKNKYKETSIVKKKKVRIKYSLFIKINKFFKERISQKIVVLSYRAQWTTSQPHRNTYLFVN